MYSCSIFRQDYLYPTIFLADFVPNLSFSCLLKRKRIYDSFKVNERASISIFEFWKRPVKILCSLLNEKKKIFFQIWNEERSRMFFNSLLNENIKILFQIWNTHVTFQNVFWEKRNNCIRSHVLMNLIMMFTLYKDEITL